MQEVNTEAPVSVPEEPTTTSPVGLTETKTIPYTAPKVSAARYWAALTSALKNGDISATEAAQLRSHLGISKRSFTKKKYNFAKVKRVNQLAKKARAVQRSRNTLKGCKVSSGKYA
jgi:hypothetical protein